MAFALTTITPDTVVLSVPYPLIPSFLYHYHYNKLMDRASQVLAQGFSPDVLRTYAASVEQGDVPLSTRHHRAHGRPETNSILPRRKKKLS